MIARFMGALFAPDQPKFYTGRHRAPARFRLAAERLRHEPVAKLAS